MRVRFRHLRHTAIIACHLLLVVFSLISAALLRFDFYLPQNESYIITQGLWIALGVKMIVFRVARFDRGGWRFAGIADLIRILVANCVASAIFATLSILFIGPKFPRSIYIIDLGLCFVLTAGVRFAVRLHYEGLARQSRGPGRKTILIYGAGAAAATLLREIRMNPALGYRVAGILDDDPAKAQVGLFGTAVLGSGRDAAQIVQRYAARGGRIDEIIIAMPSATGRQMSDALANCRAAGVACKTIPSMSELLTGKVLSGQIRDVSVLDLLGREPVELDRTLIQTSIQGKTVMVTGAAGSIGSEICRQVARYRPHRIVAFERAESDLYRLQLEMAERMPSVEFVAQIGDIRDADSAETAIRKYAVDSIFHAAAYKHVPMMESHVVEAVQNNVFGTRTMVDVAYRCGVKTFLMISSDKAVNPTNVMGATKRIAEQIVSTMPPPQDDKGTKFVSVRFGNVLGSNGSVIPHFKQQIAMGGPVTVTHPDITRYFMTIPEAVELVLQASTMGRGSEIFVLDMGEPVRIVDLARNMIRLSGREPDVDIEIRFTGLRPGEKLFEELVLEDETMMPTFHQKIKIFGGNTLKRPQIDRHLVRLAGFTTKRDELAAIGEMKLLVPEYTPVGEWKEKLQPDRSWVAASR
jgi:FlaA1/EpsC-like NDP-sugar epimerase